MSSLPTAGAAWLYTVSQKNGAKMFLSQVRQMSTNRDNSWQSDKG